MNKYKTGILTAVAALVFITAACASGNSANARHFDPPVTIAVDTDVRHQYVRGFGGMSNAWTSPVINEDDISSLYGENGLGYNIFRIIIYPDSELWGALVPVARKAQGYGALILATPWTPPAELKSNNSIVGGYLPQINFAAYAGHLRSFVDYMANNGVKIDVISFQNEPDISVSYDSCDWSPGDMLDFVLNYGREIGDVLIIPGEPYQFNHNFTNDILNHPEAVKNIDIIGGHIYGGGLSRYPLAEEKDKEVWMTEHLLNTKSNYSYDSTWAAAMPMAVEIHNCMSANFNAYIWWYLKRFYSMIGDGEYGTAEGQVLNRGHVLAHYAKYATGKQRVEIKRSENPHVMVTAYEGEKDISLVIVNTGSRPSEATIILPEKFESINAVESDDDGVMRPLFVQRGINENTTILRLAPESITSIRFEH